MSSTDILTDDLAVPVGPQDHVQGQLTAPVMLVEYGDYQCPYCAQAAAVVQELQNELGDRLCYVFRHFPLAQLHSHAMKAAEAAEAAAVQDEFWQMHYTLFSYQSALGDADLLRYARELGLDMEQFEHDLKDEGHSPVQEDINTGIESGVEGTPAFFINGIRHQGSWELDELRSAISALLT